VALTVALGVSPDVRAQDATGPNPHGAMGSPHGGGAPGGGFFTPPQDGADLDPTIPVGTIVATILEADDSPSKNAEVVLLATQQSVAQGDSHSRLVATTDETGSVKFSGLSFATGSSYTLQSSRGGATYEVGPLSLNDQSGARAILHVYDATKSLDEVRVLSQTSIALSIKEDVIVVEQRVDLANLDPISWLADEEIPLPKGFKAFTTADGSSPSVVATDKGARIQGTVPPGGAQVVFRYHLPLEDTATQSFDMAMPPRSASVRVIAEASKKMGMNITGFPDATRQKDKTGKGFLITQKRVQRGDKGFLSTVHVELTGLPTRGWAPWLAVALAGVALAAGAAYVASRGSKPGMAEDTLDDLLEAKEVLLGDIVELERMHQRGEVGPKTYARLRQAMLDALARIVTKIEGGARPLVGGAAVATGSPAAASAPKPAAPAPVAERRARTKARKAERPRAEEKPG
jgi:hypothetical protein